LVALWIRNKVVELHLLAALGLPFARDILLHIAQKAILNIGCGMALYEVCFFDCFRIILACLAGIRDF
jgi:hypothetical protein